MSILLSIVVSFTAVAQTPQIAQDLPATNFVGEQLCFTIDISNDDPAVGYGPYLRLVFPAELTFESIEFFGGGTVALDEVFQNDPIEDPLTETDVMGNSGERLVIFELPVGSVVQDGPELESEVCFTINTNSPIGVGIPIQITPIFRFGNTATGENGPIVGATQMP
ncbi:MAG: hypothetical protein AB8G22_29625, partial [Saprospiraceae bacterium]